MVKRREDERTAFMKLLQSEDNAMTRDPHYSKMIEQRHHGER